MDYFDELWNKFGVVAALIEGLPDKKIGRTAVMKFVYLLQTIRRVPLGYNFRLYTYGPFDSAVLGDLEYAQALEVFKTKVVDYQGGYYYETRLGKKAAGIRKKAAPFVEKYTDDIKWVTAKFGTKSAGELELITTLIFADRDYKKDGKTVSDDELVRAVHEIKPYFSEERIRENMLELKKDGLLTAVES